MEVKDTQDYFEKAKEAANFIINSLGTAEIAVVLGSGLNNFTDELTNTKELHYGEIPHVPQPTVKGHSGKLVIGNIGNKRVFCLAGRSHAYEGRHMYELTFFTRILKLAGCKLMISTNASGGAMEGMYPGCLMIIKDHINFYKRNPLSDTCEFGTFGKHHTDLSSIYSKRVGDIAKATAKKLGVELFEGVYGGTSGPTYETPAEVRAFTTLGASCFGMSTMPETMAAKAIGMESFAISLITNMASGLTKEVLTHTGVTAVASESGPAFVRFMKDFLHEVTVEDNLASECLSQNTVTLLPQPQLPAVTQKQMIDAVESVTKTLQITNLSTAILLSEGHDSFIEKLSERREVNYRDIPHFPGITASRKGKLVAGSIQSRQVLCFVGNSLEGFSCEEATFVSELLKNLDCKLFIQTFISGTTTTEDQLNQVVILSDCLDTTTIHPVPRRIPLNQYNVENELFNRRYIDIALSLDKEIVEGAYCHVPGPSYPTAAEVNIARLTRCKSVGTTSVPCIYSARALGIEVIGIAENSYFASQPEIKSTTNILDILAKVVNAVEPSPSSPVRYLEVDPASQVSYHLAVPVVQGFYDEVLGAAQYIKDKIKSSALIGIVVDNHFDLLNFNKLTIIHEFSHKEIPFMNNNSRGQLIFGELDGVPVYITKGMNSYSNEGLASYESTFHIRLLSVLDAKKILFISPVCSVDPLLNVGDISVINDHVLMSGRSPLFGPNEDRWGTRFPDVGEAYSKELQQSLFDSAEELEIRPLSIVFGHVVGPVVNSKIDAQYAQTMGLQAISTGIAAEVLTARHMGVAVGGLTVTVASIHSNKSSQIIPSKLDLLITKSVKAAYK